MKVAAQACPMWLCDSARVLSEQLPSAEAWWPSADEEDLKMECYRTNSSLFVFRFNLFPCRLCSAKAAKRTLLSRTEKRQLKLTDR